ncbi:Glycosyl transferase, family 14 [Sesbania bispinosa]|nr:Glycosyl transferase, family 14 [Sesbania bispinosa]
MLGGIMLSTGHHEDSINEAEGKYEGKENGASYDDHLTPAERRFLQQTEKLELKRLAKMASRSHRDRIQQFNQYLANLSEHYDIPKFDCAGRHAVFPVRPGYEGKTSCTAWPNGIRNLVMMVGSRKKSLKRPTWIIVLVSVVCLVMITAYVYPSTNPARCFFLSSRSRGCRTYDLHPYAYFSRELTDEEIESRIVIKELLKSLPLHTKNPKVAFLFLTPGSLPFEKLWHMFFQGHEGKFSIYIHASKEKPAHVSRYFVGREIHSEPVSWGGFSMVEAEKRLLANALLDPDNQHFVLLSESCIPLRHFEFVYNYLLFSNVSFIEWYIEHMLPEVEQKDFQKGSQHLKQSVLIGCFYDFFLPMVLLILYPALYSCLQITAALAFGNITDVTYEEGSFLF